MSELSGKLCGWFNDHPYCLMQKNMFFEMCHWQDLKY